MTKFSFKAKYVCLKSTFRSISNSNSRQFSSSEVIEWICCSWNDKRSSTTGTFTPSFSKTATKNGAENYLTWLVRNIWQNVSSRPTGVLFRFLRMTLLAVLFPLLLRNCFLRVCLPTLFAAVLKFSLPLTTSAFPGAPNYKKSAPTHFANRKIFCRKLEIQFSQKIVQVYRIPLHVGDQYFYRM